MSESESDTHACVVLKRGGWWCGLPVPGLDLPWTSAVVQDLERALYMSPQDAQEYGVIDRILKPYEQ